MFKNGHTVNGTKRALDKKNLHNYNFCVILEILTKHCEYKNLLHPRYLLLEFTGFFQSILKYIPIYDVCISHIYLNMCMYTNKYIYINTHSYMFISRPPKKSKLTIK